MTQLPLGIVVAKSVTGNIVWYTVSSAPKMTQVRANTSGENSSTLTVFIQCAECLFGSDELYFLLKYIPILKQTFDCHQARRIIIFSCREEVMPVYDGKLDTQPSLVCTRVTIAKKSSLRGIAALQKPCHERATTHPTSFVSNMNTQMFLKLFILLKNKAQYAANYVRGNYPLLQETEQSASFLGRRTT